MNERIKQFAEQAGYKHSDAVGMCEDYAYFNHEKFAQLIIGDCIQTLINNGYDDAAKCLQDIHFGMDYPV